MIFAANFFKKAKANYIKCVLKEKPLNRVSACRIVNLLYLLGLFLNASSL
jgi:hypothetical protein